MSINPQELRENDEPLQLATLSPPGDSSGTRLWATLFAFGLSAGLLLGFFYLRAKHRETLNTSKNAELSARTAAPPQAQIFQNEVRLKGSQALVGGTVRNLSTTTLASLSVEITLKGRAGQTNETRRVELSPSVLRPGEEGKYSLLISPSVWAGAQVLRLHSEDQNSDIPFKPELGERRPLERPPSTKVIVAPRPRQKGDDFINTPDSPIKIP